MASILKVDTLTGVTTAGSISVTGEGNSTTTNLQQGLAKVWVHFDGHTGNDIRDSLNITSATDHSTGRYEYFFTNNMSSAYYCYSHNCGGATGSSGDDSYGNTGGAGVSGGLNTDSMYSRSRHYNGSIYDIDVDCMMAHGDLT